MVSRVAGCSSSLSSHGLRTEESQSTCWCEPAGSNALPKPAEVLRKDLICWRTGQVSDIQLV